MEWNTCNRLRLTNQWLSPLTVNVSSVRGGEANQLSTPIRRLSLISFKEYSVEENGSSDNDTLLTGCCSIGEGKVKGICISEHLGRQTLGFFHDLSKIRSVTTCAACIRRVNTKGLLTASLTTRISLRAAVNAQTSTASRGANKVEFFFLVIENREPWDTGGTSRGC